MVLVSACDASQHHVMLGTMWPLLASKSHMVPSIVRLRREGGGARAGVGGGVALGVRLWGWKGLCLIRRRILGT